MRNVVLIGAGLGLTWHLALAAFSMGDPESLISVGPLGILAGIATGLLATWHTLWTRNRHAGEERFWSGVSNYILSVAFYGAAQGLIFMGTTNETSPSLFDFGIGASVMAFFFVVGSLWVFGVFLLPLCFASRQLVWSVASRPHDAEGSSPHSAPADPGFS